MATDSILRMNEAAYNCQPGNYWERPMFRRISAIAEMMMMRFNFFHLGFF